MTFRGCKFAGVVSSAFVAAALLSFPELKAPQRDPASAGSGLLEYARALKSKALATSLSGGNCAELRSVVSAVEAIRPTEFTRSEVIADAEAVLRLLFEGRVELRERMKTAYAQGRLTETCANEIRKTFRHLRGVEDFVGVVAREHRQSLLPQGFVPIPSRPYDPNAIRQDNVRVVRPRFVPAPIATFPDPGAIEGPSYLPNSALVNPKLATAPGLRSGDILLSRGNANTSALIARMGHEDTQFSHLAQVYVDPRTKKAWTVEAHIELGSVIAPLSDWLKDGKSRTVVYRHGDPALAHRAAEYIYRRVKNAYDSGNTIKYDFAFNMHDPGRLFCSEVSREGYSVASGGKLQIPLFASHLTMKNRDIMDRLGIDQTQSFVPADMEIDPRFEMIAEWRDFAKLPNVWRKDAILTSIYAWVERDGYEFSSTFGQRAKGVIARGIRKAGFIEERMPTYMPQSVIVLNFMLDAVVEELEELLAPIEAAHRKRTGYPLNYFEYMSELDAIQRRLGPDAEGPFEYLHRP